MTSAWFIVWTTLAGSIGEIGPFLYRETCERAIENALAVADAWGQDDWRLPSDAACVERRR